QRAYQPASLAGVDEVVDDQQPLAGAAAKLSHRIRDPLENLEIALLVVVVARHAHGIDDANTELPRNNRGRHQSAARDGDDSMERADLGEPPGQRPAIPVKLVPGDGERLFGIVVGHATYVLQADFRAACSAASIS